MYKRKGKAYALSIGVWRSLVARLNGVQEAASSILVTPTKKEQGFHPAFFCVGVRLTCDLYKPHSTYITGSPKDCEAIFWGEGKSFREKKQRKRVAFIAENF